MTCTCLFQAALWTTGWGLVTSRTASRFREGSTEDMRKIVSTVCLNGMEIVSTVCLNGMEIVSTVCLNMHGDLSTVYLNGMEIVRTVCLNVQKSTKSHILNIPSTH
jgi:hypothetical protein